MQTKKLGVAAMGLLFVAVAGCGHSAHSSEGATSTTPTQPTTSASATVSPSASTAGPAYFKATVSPSTNVAAGTAVTAKGVGAKPSTAYYCLVVATSVKTQGDSASSTSSLTKVDSNAKGTVTCTVTYQPFSAKDKEGVVRHCPTTAADRKAGFQCGVAFADAGTTGALSASFAPFMAK